VTQDRVLSAPGTQLAGGEAVKEGLLGDRDFDSSCPIKAGLVHDSQGGCSRSCSTDMITIGADRDRIEWARFRRQHQGAIPNQKASFCATAVAGGRGCAIGREHEPSTAVWQPPYRGNRRGNRGDGFGSDCGHRCPVCDAVGRPENRSKFPRLAALPAEGTEPENATTRRHRRNRPRKSLPTISLVHFAA